MSRKYLQELIRGLQEYYKCPSCSINYHFDDIKLLGEIEAYCFVQLTCHNCSLPVLATVSVSGKKGAKPKTDLKPREKTKFMDKGPVSAGEIAEFHRFISSLRGGIGKISK